MEMWQETTLLLVAGVLTGVVNTISGSGTLFSLGAMIMIDIPIVLANTSNRPGVFVQNFSGLLSISRHGNLFLKKIPWNLVFFSTIGAVAGAYFAVNVSDQLLVIVASLAMVVSLRMMLFPISRPLLQDKNEKSLSYLKWLLFLMIGFYGGLIQIGVGLLMLAVITNFVTEEYREANILKLIIILIYTIPTTIYFIVGDQILWKAAVLLAAGQFVGAYLAGFFMVVNKNVKFWSKLLTVVFSIVTLVKIWFFNG